MLTRFENAIALSAGAYDIDGNQYGWVDFYDPESREKVLRMGVHKDCPRFEVVVGQVFNLVVDVQNRTSVVKGTDRTATSAKLTIHEASASKVNSNGRGSREQVAAVA